MTNNANRKITKEQIINLPEKWFTDKMVEVTRKAVNSYGWRKCIERILRQSLKGYVCRRH